MRAALLAFDNLNNFNFLEPVSLKKVISALKQEKWTLSPLKSAYSKLFRCQVSASADSFDFLNQIFPKMVFVCLKQKKLDTTIEFYIFQFV